MKLFLAHSFSDEGLLVAQEIKEFLESARIEYISGKKPESKGVSEKVKERIDECDIFMGIFIKEKEISSEESEKYYTTSNWVIQESGFAIGREKELILLIESGIDSFPGLQGDLEFIEFDRDNVSKSFTRVTHMINAIKDEKTELKQQNDKEVLAESELSEEESTNKISESESAKEPTKKLEGLDTEEKTEKLRKEIKSALFVEKDYVKARKIFPEYEKTLEEDRKLIMKAVLLRCCHSVGDGSAFNELLNFININKDNADVNIQLAHRYKEMNEYGKAADEFLKVSSLYNPDDEDGLTNIVYCHERASLCMALDGQCDKAYNLLLNLLNSNEELEGYKARILSSLASIAKKCEDSKKLIIYGEPSLDIDPSNTNLRFRVAYAHSNLGNRKLSILHYKKLVNTDEKYDAGLNNLGVEYNALKMPAKSIESYNKAMNLKNTLAIANLADKYLNEGFIENATTMIDNANNLANEDIEVHGNIGLAKNRIDQIKLNEENKEKKILSEAEKERKFRVKYSKAYYSQNDINIKEICGIWSIESLNLDMNIDKDQFKINEEFFKKKDSKSWLKLSDDDEDYSSQKSIKIEGNIQNLSGVYSISIEEKGKYGTVFSSYNATGYMLIKKDLSVIDVMEKSNDEIRFKKWTKIID